MKLCFKVVCLFLLLARILLAQTRLLMVAWFAAGLTNHIDTLIQIQLKLNLLFLTTVFHWYVADESPDWQLCSVGSQTELLFSQTQVVLWKFVAFALMVNWDLSRINEVSISCDANFMSWIPYTSFLTGELVCLLLQSHHGLVHWNFSALFSWNVFVLPQNNAMMDSGFTILDGIDTAPTYTVICSTVLSHWKLCVVMPNVAPVCEVSPLYHLHFPALKLISWLIKLLGLQGAMCMQQIMVST